MYLNLNIFFLLVFINRIMFIQDKCPANTLCLQRDAFYLLLTATLIITYAYFKNKETKDAERSKEKEYDNKIADLENKLTQEKNVDGDIDEYIRQRDMKIQRANDPLEPPERIHTSKYTVPINTPTRGRTPEYQQVGILTKEGITDDTQQIGNNSEVTVLPLYGRQTYPSSNKWNYYTATDKFNMMRIPVDNKGKNCTEEYGCEEIYNGDTLQLPAYNGNFKVTIYEFNKPRYIPYFY